MMKEGKRLIVAGAVLLLCVSFGAVAQEPELPFDWEGKGIATMATQDGIRDIEYDFELHVDGDGMVSGQSKTGDGSAKIERLYYSEPVKAGEWNLSSRKVVMVLSIRSSDTPLAILMNGQVLNEKFVYGELRIARLNDVKEDLNIGNKEATAMGSDSLPSGVSKAMKNSIPVGCFQMEAKTEDKDN